MKKQEPPGICDQCKGKIRDSTYTTKGTLRLYCSRLCRNTANSRAGAQIRSEKAKARVAAGTWENPADSLTPEQKRANIKRAGAAAGEIFKEQVKAGTWRNPALSEEAREKLSRPRVITDAVLHSALEKLTRGLSVSELTPEEADKHREYRRNLAKQKRAFN